jgi:hypothetical protein
MSSDNHLRTAHSEAIWFCPDITVLRAIKHSAAGINCRPGYEAEGIMKARAPSIVIAAATGAIGVTACSPAVTACRVQHHYAIVVFQNGGAGVGKTLVTRFRLNVKYSPYYTHRMIKYEHLTLNPARGNRLPVVVKTYRVGHAHSCHVDHVKTHQK